LPFSFTMHGITILLKPKLSLLSRPMFDEMSTFVFARQLLQGFIPDTFHENSYLQKHLVNIYKALDEMPTLVKQAPSNGRTGADELCRMLLAFCPQLSASFGRGGIKYGFIRDHAWYRTPLPVTLQYILSPLLGKLTIAMKTAGEEDASATKQELDF
jgi:hypothetical protein